MKEKKIEKLTEKYEAGASTLHEEQFLFDNADNSRSMIEAWSSFVKRYKRKAPENFNDTLWDSFQNRTIRKRRFKIGIMSAAASVILIIALFIGIPGQKKLSYNEKEALLNQAQNMFIDSEQEIIKGNIIYEDEMIIIYTSIE